MSDLLYKWVRLRCYPQVSANAVLKRENGLGRTKFAPMCPNLTFILDQNFFGAVRRPPKGCGHLGIPFLLEIGFKTGEGRAILDRHGLSNEQWELVEPLLPGKVGDRGRSGADNRKFVDAVLWIATTGAAWRDLPTNFGNWNSNFRRFRRWAIKGIFDVLFERLSGDPDFEYAMIDGTIIRVHQQGTGARGGLIVRRSAVRVAD